MARILLVVALLGGCSDGQSDRPPLRLTVMYFNTYGAGVNDGKTIDETVAVIRAVNPDIVAVGEVRAESDPCTADCPATGPSRAPEIAAALGYSFYEQQQQNEALWANAILSRYPIAGSTANDLGVVINAADRQVAMFGVHFNDYPYQPYQLLGIEYDGAPFLDTADAAIAAATAARAPGLELLLADLASVADVDAVFVGGDFNEPSHRDWSERAAAIGRHPAVVPFPTVLRLETIGFVDTFNEQVNPYVWPGGSCYVEEIDVDPAVEVENGCGSLQVSAGSGDSCTITNTLFCEGIPTLSQYGMAVLALLMLGVGLISFRRFS